MNQPAGPAGAERLSSQEDEHARLLHLLTVGGVTAFERIGDGDLLLGPANPWAVLGFAPNELPATRTALISRLHPDDAADAEPKVAQAVDEDCLLGRLRMRDGSYRRFRQRTRAIRLADGQTRVVCCLIDVEDNEHARDTVPVAQPSADDLAPRRHDDALRLVARASHEIRTPLNGVLGLVELARRLCTSQVQLRHLDMATESGRALTNVLNGVLDLASLSNPQSASSPEWVDLDALCAEALRSITPQMGWGDFSVLYDYDSNAVRVRVDPIRLRQVLVNLLGNAAKVTEQGHIGLSVHVRCIDDDRCDLRLLIEDTGPGIAADLLPGLFEPFSMVAAQRRHGGTGLGLSIVKALVSSMHGCISVSSEVGRGTRFELRLRLESEREIDNTDQAALRGGSAWLFYAQPFIVGGEWLSRRLERLGWTAELLHSAASIKERAEQVQPDVLLVAAHSVQSATDLQELAAALPRTRLVLLSRADWGKSDVEQQALDSGVHCVLVPVSHRDLLSITSSVGNTGVPPAPASSRQSAQAELRGRVLLVDDDEVNRLVGEHVLESFQLTVHCVDSGEQALAACFADPPGAVLMDVQMPGIGGLEACRRIRAAQQQGRLPPFPVIGLSADSTDEAIRAGDAAGMALMLAKPCRPEALRLALARWLKKR